MEVFTIGFTRKSAAEFFGALRETGIRRLVDIRLNNTSQLAAFTKKDDLSFFLRELCDADYVHEPLLAPSEEILSDYRKKKIGWPEYERRFMDLMAEREAHEQIDRSLFSVPTVLLCSEAEPDQCHRRLAAEYLREKWGNVEIIHL